MNRHLPISLFWRLSGLYAGLGIVLTIGMLLSKWIVSRGGLPGLKFVLTGIAVAYTPVLALLMIMTWMRLFRAVSRPGAAMRDEETRLRLWRRLIGFPRELRLVYAAVALCASTVYRLATVGAMMPLGVSAAVAEWIRGLLFDMTTFAALALLHEVLVSWLLRPHIRSLHVYEHRFRHFSSTGVLLLIALCGLIYAPVRLLGYVQAAARDGEGMSWLAITAIGWIVLAVTLGAIGLTSAHMLKDIRRMSDQLRAAVTASRQKRNAWIPATSRYEAGELAVVINRLQNLLAQDYDRLQRELELAGRIRQQLLPTAESIVGGWHMRAIGGAAGEIDGRFYDWQLLPGGRVLLAAGYVSGSGLSAALVMAAVLQVLRAGGDGRSAAADRLDVLAATFEGIWNKERCLHIALAELDPADGVMYWMSAGDTTVSAAFADGTAVPVADRSCPPIGAGGEEARSSGRLPRGLLGVALGAGCQSGESGDSGESGESAAVPGIQLLARRVGGEPDAYAG